jgi:hypothetical protein
MTTTPPVTTLSCEKCHAGAMIRTRVSKFSTALVLIGYTLWIPALLLLLGTTACTILTMGAGTARTAKVALDAKREAIEKLGKIENLPPIVLTEFERDDKVQDSTLSSLPDEQRTEVSSIVISYSGQIAGAAIGGTAAAGIGGCALVTVYVFCVPLFIIGLVLTLKKNIWQCPACGYVFDRA